MGELILDKAEEKGRMREIYQSVQECDYSVARGAEKAGMPIDEFVKKMKQAGYKIQKDKNAEHITYSAFFIITNYQ